MLPKNIPSVFIDADVFFDIISGRRPFFEDSVKVLELLYKGNIAITTSESCLANLIYLAIDTNKIPNASSKISSLIASCTILCCGKKGILEALASAFKDKEDAVQYYTALYNDIDYFVTRNVKDYKLAVKSLPVITPTELVEMCLTH